MQREYIVLTILGRGEGLDHCSRFRGLDVRFEYFRGSQGFVAWALDVRLRDFPLWVFLKPSLTNSLGVINNRFYYACFKPFGTLSPTPVKN